MARTKREISPIGAYHVLLRSIEELFRDEADKDEFVRLCEKYFTDIHVYTLALLPHKIHMVLGGADGSVSSTLKPLTTSYARYYNRRYAREGKLFSDRYKSAALYDNDQITGSVIYVDSMYETQPTSGRKYFYDELCPRRKYNSMLKGRLERVGIDDYDMFTDDDVLSVICRLTGTEPSALKDMSKNEKTELVLEAVQHKWVSMRRMCEALGLGSTAAIYARSEKGSDDGASAPSAKPSGSSPRKKAPKSELVSAEENKDATQDASPADDGDSESKSSRRDLSVWLL